jgi:DNA helicase-2/ATP-dependent DNA helicase PcrA
VAALHARARNDGTQPGLDAFNAVLTALGWSENIPGGAGRAREQWESWQALSALAKEIDDALGQPDFAALLAEFDSRASAQEIPSADGVNLSTIHASKGQEWACVAVIGLSEGLVPFSLAQSPEELAEENRLFYVGITRAKDWLRLSYSNAGPGGKRQPSRFLQGIGLARSHETNEQHKPKRVKKTAKCRVCGQMLSSGPELKLGHHLDCLVSYDEALLEALKAWRLQESKQAQVPAYVVFTDATLIAIAETKPADEAQLLAVAGVGAHKLERYGAKVLELIEQSRGQDEKKP